MVLSQRFSAPFEGDGLDLYRVLRAVNPSPYMFYVRTREVTLVGSSPEPLVRVEGDSSSPARSPARALAGRRCRGWPARAPSSSPTRRSAPSTSCSWTSVATTSVASAPRERSSVDELMEVENYSHVMHIVSGLTGRLAPGHDAFDALARPSRRAR